MKTLAWLIALLVYVGLPPSSLGQSSESDLRAHGGPVRALAAMADGRLASAGFDSTIIVWDLKRGQAELVLRQHETAVNALVARSDGCLISGGEDSRIKVWCNAAAAVTLAGHEAAISSIAILADGRSLVSGSWDRTVRVWDAHGDARVLTEHATPVTSVALSSDGASVLSASQDGVVRLTPMTSTSLPLVLKLGVPINGLVTTPGGEVVLACADGILREVNSQFAVAREVAKVDGPLTAVAISPDGSTIAASGLRTPVTLIDRRTGEVKTLSATARLPIWAVAFSRDGRDLFTGGGDRAVRRFDAVTGNSRAPSIAAAPDPELTSMKDPGARVFRACAACHGVTAEDTNLAGPTLHQIMGRRIASLKGYEFSRALLGMEIVWTPQTIAKLFEVGPNAFAPGTKMPEQRITDSDERKALVDWLARVTVP